MASKHWIPHMIRECTPSRQAHCDLPEGTYEREMGREGFFGPASHIHHRHPPTGWVDWARGSRGSLTSPTATAARAS